MTFLEEVQERRNMRERMTHEQEEQDKAAFRTYQAHRPAHKPCRPHGRDLPLPPPLPRFQRLAAPHTRDRMWFCTCSSDGHSKSHLCAGPEGCG